MIDIQDDSRRSARALVFIILFLILAFLVKTGNGLVYGFDFAIQRILQPITFPALIGLIHLVTYLGCPPFALLLTTGASAWIFFKYDHIDGIWAFGTTIVCMGVAFIMKHVVARPRPLNKLAPADGFSFPSGHVFTTMLLVLIVLTFILPRMENQDRRQMLRVALICWVIFIAFTRIYLRDHFATDTIGSALLAGGLWEVSLLCYTKFVGTSKYFKS